MLSHKSHTNNKRKMSKYNCFIVLLLLGLTLSLTGCISPEIKQGSVKNIVGGIVVGISPKVIYADKGENVTFSIDLASTENADDRVTIQIRDTWIERKITQDILAGKNLSVPVQVTVPAYAANTSFRVNAISSNLNATSSTSGIILINEGD